ncbi:MAG: hypothetical protein U0800_10670 [Isosphaeraceae bacterium]
MKPGRQPARPSDPSPTPPKKKRPDGDRARRTPTDLVRDALQRKRKTRDWTIDDAPIDFPDPTG